MVREGSRKTAHGSSLKAEGSKFITLPGQSLGKLRSEGGMAFLASLRSAGAELEERKEGDTKRMEGKERGKKIGKEDSAGSDSGKRVKIRRDEQKEK